MSYTKLKWLNEGETGAIPINKENLNHMDDGIAESDMFRNLFNVGNAKTSYNADLNFDKTNNQILINGSSTTGTDIFLNSPGTNKDKDGIILKAGTYTATIKKVSGSLSNDKINFFLRKSDGSSVYDGTKVYEQEISADVSDGTIYSSSFTLEKETRLHWLGYFDSASKTFDNLILEFQIEENTEATEYTPFAGYIVESGSNDNGSWIKFSDGTMICNGKIDKSLFDGNEQSFYTEAQGIKIYRSDDPWVNFPLPFSDNNVTLNLSVENTGAGCRLQIPRIANIETNRFHIQLLALEDFYNNGLAIQSISYVHWQAIGRWK